MKNIIYGILSLGLWACGGTVDIDMPPAQREVVVDGWIKNDGFAEVFLTESFPVVSTFDSISIHKTFLNYAKVEIFEDTGESEVLTLYKKDGFFPPYVYRTLRMKGQVGHRYKLKIWVKGKVLEAETTIPTPPEVSFKVDKIDAERMHIVSAVSDVANQKDYYFYKIKRKGIDEIYHPSLSSAFTDTDYDGQKILRRLEKGVAENLVNTIIGEPDSIDTKRDEFLLSDTVFIEYSTINKQSYEVLFSIFLDMQTAENPFALAGEKVETNVQGGIGHFTGLGAVHALAAGDTVFVAH